MLVYSAGEVILSTWKETEWGTVEEKEEGRMQKELWDTNEKSKRELCEECVRTLVQNHTHWKLPLKKGIRYNGQYARQEGGKCSASQNLIAV